MKNLPRCIWREYQKIMITLRVEFNFIENNADDNLQK